MRLPNPSARRDSIIGIITALWMAFAIAFNINIIRASLGELGDFGSFIAAGFEYKKGGDPYGTDTGLIFEARFPKWGAGGRLPNLNPPISLLLFGLIPGENYITSVNIWRISSVVIYLISALLLAAHFKPSPLEFFWIFSLAGFWHTIGLGQIYTPLLLLITLAWLSFAYKRDLFAGIFLGLLVCIKPNFLCWILLLLILRQRKAVLAASITAAAGSLLPLAFMPPVIYHQWLEAARVDTAILIMPGNSSFSGLMSRMNLPSLGFVLGGTFVLLSLWSVLRTNNQGDRSPENAHTMGILLSLLISPISWVGYSILTIPIFFWYRKGGNFQWIPALMLTMPFNFVMHLYYNTGRLGFVFWGWWYGLSLTLLLLYILRDINNSVSRSAAENP